MLCALCQICDGVQVRHRYVNWLLIGLHWGHVAASLSGCGRVVDNMVHINFTTTIETSHSNKSQVI